MLDFFGALLCECGAFELDRVAMTTPDDAMHVSHWRVTCIGCTTVFYADADSATEHDLVQTQVRRNAA